MNTILKQTAIASTTLVLTLIAQTTFAEARDSKLIKRGELLVTVGGCVDCHTPFKMGANGPEKDMSRGMSGHPESVKLPPPPALSKEWNWAGAATGTAFVGPWGTTYSANLTPDRETGMGGWKEKDFIQAMRTGKHIGVARPILPPMPWQGLAALPDWDLRAIYAYLMAQPAVKNKVPDYAPPAVGEMR
jgi:mono/diheme cytochrome c family protein